MNERASAPWRDWGGLAAIVVGAALFAMLVAGFGWTSGLADLLEGFLVAVTVSACISGLIVLIIPRLMRRMWPRLAFPYNWAVLTAALVLVGAAGSLAAVVILASIGRVPIDAILTAWLQGSLRISLIVTLTFGLFVFAQEANRARLDAAMLALRTKERDEAEARLSALEARVQPHFLFNTLNSIASLVHSDPAGAERMITQLASLLRSSLDRESVALVPLSEEIASVRDYLEIEAVRLGERLRFSLDVPDSAGSVAVPRLALQTLVENAVKHVVAVRRHGGTIRVSAESSASRLALTVEDDGPGFDRDAIASGHGLSLLRERIAMLYDGAAELTVGGTRGGRVSLTVPIRTATSAGTGGV
jgi:sensor histidine kinase YesM